MSGHDSDVDSMLFSASDDEPVSFDSILRTPEEVDDGPAADDQLASDSSCGHHPQLSEGSTLHSPCSASEVSAVTNLPEVQLQTAHLPSQDPPQSSSKKRRFPRLGENLDGSVRPRLIIKSC